MQPKKFRRFLVSGRATVGWLAVLAPGIMSKVWRLNSPLGSETKYLIRFFGIRNVVLAYQLYQADRPDAGPEELEEALRQGIVIDTLDLAFILFSKKHSESRSFGRTAPGLAAAAGIVLGMLSRQIVKCPRSLNSENQNYLSRFEFSTLLLIP